MIRYAVLDMDGTILNDRREILPSVKQALSDFRAGGGTIVLATGRSMRALEPFRRELKIETPVVCYNGVVVFDTAAQKELFTRPMDKNDFRLVLDYCRRNDVYCHAFSHNDAWFYEKEGPEAREYTERVGYAGTQRSLDFLEEEKRLVYKMMISGEPEKLAVIRQDLLPLLEGDKTVVYSSMPFLLEIHSSAADKGEAVDWLFRHKGWNWQESLAAGDGENDISMLQRAAVSVAMGSASEKLKKSCTHRTEDSNNAGLARAFKRILT